MWKSPNFGNKTKWIVTAIFALLVLGSYNNQHSTPRRSVVTQSTPAPAPKQYAAVDANTMMNDLERNAAAAQKKYKGQSLCVTGRIGVIDSDGDYILLHSDNQFAINGIICRLNTKDNAQKNFLLSVSKDQYIRAYGEVIDVGEAIGYSLSVDKFEPAR